MNVPLSATPPVDLEALIAKAAALQAAAKAAREPPNRALMIVSPDAVLALCEEIKRLRASSASPAVDEGVRLEQLVPASEGGER